MQKTMNESNGHGSVYGTIITVFLYLLSVWSIQEWAAAATVFAGVSTGAFTIYKWITYHKKKSKPDE